MRVTICLGSVVYDSLNMIMGLSFFCVLWIIATVQGIQYVDHRVLSGQPLSVKRAYLNCADSTKVEPEMILQLKKGNWMEDERLKQWVLCVLVSTNYMTEQGVLQLDVALKNKSAAEKNTLEKHIDLCLPTKRFKPREIAFRFAKCFHERASNQSMF